MTRAILTAFILFGLGSQAVHANPGWKSGTSGGNAISFAAWRGTALGLATGWAPWDSSKKYYTQLHERQGPAYAQGKVGKR